MSNSQFASLSPVNVKGTSMEVSPRLKVSECCKEFRRFVGSRVETSRPRWRCWASKCLQCKRNHGRSGRSFTCSSERTAAQAKVCRTVASKWPASLQVRDWHAGGEEIRIHRGHSSDFRKGVHWNSVSDPLPSFGPCTDCGNGDEKCPHTSTLSGFFDCTPWCMDSTDRGRAAWPHQAATCQSESSRRVEQQALFSLAFLSYGFKLTDGRTSIWGRKRALKSLLWGECWSLCIRVIEILGLFILQNNDRSRMSVLVFNYILPLVQSLVRPYIIIFSTHIVISINSFLFSFCIFVLFSLAWDWRKKWTWNRELNWSSVSVVVVGFSCLQLWGMLGQVKTIDFGFANSSLRSCT